MNLLLGKSWMAVSIRGFTQQLPAPFAHIQTHCSGSHFEGENIQMLDLNSTFGLCVCVWAGSRVLTPPPLLSLQGFWPQTPPSWGRRTSLGTCSLCHGSPPWMCPDCSRWPMAEATVTGPPRAACWSNRQVRTGRGQGNVQKMHRLSDWINHHCLDF